jgi:hypothetical protein
MTQADSVLSTPPTNTLVDTTRRRFLAVAASASGAGAGSLFDDLNRDLYDFAVGRLSEMLDDLKARYFAAEFPICESPTTPSKPVTAG